MVRGLEEPLKHAGINPLVRAAYHEAGHAVVWRHFDRRISFIVITEAGNGLTSITRSVQYVGPPRPPEPVPADHPQCVVALAGRAAETIRYPGLQRAELVELSGSDQAQAAGLIRELRGSSISDNEISAEIAALEAEGLQILGQEWAAVEALAAALLAHPEHALDGDEAVRVMDDASPAALDMAVTIDGNEPDAHLPDDKSRKEAE